MRLDELTGSEIKAFKTSDWFYAVINPEPKKYEVVKLAHDEIEFDEYNDFVVLHEPEKFKYAYLFDCEGEASDYVKHLKKCDKLTEETAEFLKCVKEILKNADERNAKEEAEKKKLIVVDSLGNMDVERILE